MPIKSAPSKIKVVTYLTQIERIEAEGIARQRQLSLSEWVRQCITTATASHKIGAFIPPTPSVAHQPLPDVHTLKSDFIFGDINEPNKE